MAVSNGKLKIAKRRAKGMSHWGDRPACRRNLAARGPKTRDDMTRFFPSQWCCWNVTASGRACWSQLSSKPMLWFLGLVQSSRGWMPRSCWCCSIKTCLFMLLCNNSRTLCVLEELVWTDPHKATRENYIELSHHGFLQWKVTLGT